VLTGIHLTGNSPKSHPQHQPSPGLSSVAFVEELGRRGPKTASFLGAHVASIFQYISVGLVLRPAYRVAGKESEEQDAAGSPAGSGVFCKVPLADSRRAPGGHYYLGSQHYSALHRHIIALMSEKKR
jgi:hypothetical protein